MARTYGCRDARASRGSRGCRCGDLRPMNSLRDRHPRDPAGAAGDRNPALGGIGLASPAQLERAVADRVRRAALRHDRLELPGSRPARVPESAEGIRGDRDRTPSLGSTGVTSVVAGVGSGSRAPACPAMVGHHGVRPPAGYEDRPPVARSCASRSSTARPRPGSRSSWTPPPTARRASTWWLRRISCARRTGGSTGGRRSRRRVSSSAGADVPATEGLKHPNGALIALDR